MKNKISTYISYISPSGDLCFIDLPMAQFDILLAVIRNSANGHTFVEHPTMSAKYQIATIMFLDQADYNKVLFVWDSKNMGFFNGMEPNFFLKMKLRFYLFFGI